MIHEKITISRFDLNLEINSYISEFAGTKLI